MNNDTRISELVKQIASHGYRIIEAELPIDDGYQIPWVLVPPSHLLYIHDGFANDAKEQALRDALAKLDEWAAAA